MKRLIATMVMLFMVTAISQMNLSAAESSVIANDETGIPDSTLYTVILKELGKEDTNENVFTEDEAETITELGGFYGTVNSLKGIGKLKNLTSLSISIPSKHSMKRGGLKSLKGIENLTNLEFADFSHNYLTEEELLDKCPKGLLMPKEDWVRKMLKTQKVINKLRLLSSKKITKKTKKITVKTNCSVEKVILLNGERIIKSNTFGEFNTKTSYTLKALNLKKLMGKRLKIKAKNYGSVKTITFKVKKK